MKRISLCLKHILMPVMVGAMLSLPLSCRPANAQKTRFMVRQDGRGDYTSIAEAAASVPSGSTLIIYEGVYEEHVDIKDKTLYLEGKDRDKCILRYDGKNYMEPPLAIAAGRVCNLTIYSCSDRDDGWFGRTPAVVDPDIPATSYLEYTVHIEQDHLAGKELTFENCRFLSDKNHCIGLGLRRDCQVSFSGCDFRSYGIGGDLFVHDAIDDAYYGRSALIFTDCTMYNYCGACFFNIQSFDTANHVDLTFQNVLVHTVGYRDCDPYTDNCYIGRDFGTLNGLDASDSLTSCGYRLDDMVFCLTKEQSSAYLNSVRACASAFETDLALPEGITGITFDQTAPTFDSTFPIYINNSGLESSDGWCGSANFFLTPESYGNTFAEMNYQGPDGS